MSSAPAWDAEKAVSRIKEWERSPGALLPILHALQDEFGYVDEAAVPLIADALNISRAEVHGVSVDDDGVVADLLPAGFLRATFAAVPAAFRVDFRAFVVTLREAFEAALGEAEARTA